ncbi:MAG: AAA family ATPase [Desulfobacterales bacterium]|nr:AAA family ATPase [Desulfobacterales bacterium]
MTKKNTTPFYNDTVWQLYDHISKDLYLGRPDMEFKERTCNSTLLMSLLTALTRGKALIIGEPGMGKTTTAEYVCAFFYRIPLETVWRSAVAGHPEQTEEKIIGRPDLGQLNRGTEVVRWSYFTLMPTKIVDEINRLPETKQSLILDGVDRGKWEYLNTAIINSEFCFFATANYADRGTNTIVAPLMDRFDIMIESKHPGANLAYRIGAQDHNGFALCDSDVEADIHRIITSPASYVQQMVQLEDVSTQFGEGLQKKFGVKTLSKQDRQEAWAQIQKIDFDLDANAFLRLIIAELSFCYHHGQKRSLEECDRGCHFSGYLCHAIKNCISNRFAMSARLFAQAFAWIFGDHLVSVNHLMAVLPYTLAHRIQWQAKFIAQWDTEMRGDPLTIYMAKKAVGEMHRRYTEQAHHIKEALAVAYRIRMGDDLEPLQGDHPLYWEILKDVGKERWEL